MVRTFIAALLAVSVASAPVAAKSAARTPAPVEEAEGIVGNPWIPILVGLLVIAALAYIVIEEGDESPTSA